MILILLLVLIVLALALAGYGLGGLGRVGVRRAGLQLWLRSTAAVLGAVAVAVYAWGLLVVCLTALDAEDGGAGSLPLRPCRIPGWEERAAGVVDYTVSYVPLDFVCRTQDGKSYAAEAVPGFVNPGAAGFALASVVCGVAAGAEGERRARRAVPRDGSVGRAGRRTRCTRP